VATVLEEDHAVIPTSARRRRSSTTRPCGSGSSSCMAEKAGGSTVKYEHARS
jgi:hypothetical protein